MLYLDLATAHFQHVLPDEWLPVIQAVTKMFNFDSQLVLEAYEAGEKQKVEKLAEERGHLLVGINAAVQDLASMMVELSGSTQSVAETAIRTAESQEKSLDTVYELTQEIEYIHHMGSLMEEISSQTQLLGLTRPLKPPAPASRVAALKSSPMKSVSSPRNPKKPLYKSMPSLTSYCACCKKSNWSRSRRPIRHKRRPPAPKSCHRSFK